MSLRSVRLTPLLQGPEVVVFRRVFSIRIRWRVYSASVYRCILFTPHFRYNATVHPQISTEFSTAASRHGHAQIPVFTFRFGKEYTDFPLVWTWFAYAAQSPEQIPTGIGFTSNDISSIDLIRPRNEPPSVCHFWREPLLRHVLASLYMY